ncbi:hypothetical protein IPJ63_03120 [Candidatus Nomurabacteria bacterium]|nr:MAG: hypothetical protein IPJ63_03120 [Candidatus Nomurabacteria bacterium]
MINSNYELSLKLFIRFESIDKLMDCCPFSKNGMWNYYYESTFYKIQKEINSGRLQFPNWNKKISNDKISQMCSAIEEIKDEIDSKLMDEKRENIVISMLLLKEELNNIILLLS